MKRTNLTLGLMLLFVAAAVAVYTTDLPRARAVANQQEAAQTYPHGVALSSFSPRHLSGKSSRLSRSSRTAVMESLKVEASIDHPAIAAQAFRIQRGAHDRLAVLAEELRLTEQQQRDIFPLLARSHPDYNTGVLLIGSDGGRVDPLSKRAAERQINKLLDLDQQLELEIMALEADAWWTDIIAALEKDLNASTKPLAIGQAPDHDPTPPDDDPPTPAIAPTPAPAFRSGRANLE